MKLAYMPGANIGKEFVWSCALAAGLLSLSGCAADNGTEATISMATPFDDPTRAREVASIYAAAKQKDSASLLALKDGAARVHKNQDPAVTLSLYLLNPATTAADFIAAYPTDAQGVMLDYGSRLAAAGLTPAGMRFPINALGDLAAKGDHTALGKLFAAFAVASEPVSGDYGREISHVAALAPHDALSAIAALPTSQQLEVTAMQGWCGRTPPLLTVPGAGAGEIGVQNEIRARLGSCPTPPPHKKHRKAHKPHPHKGNGGKHKPNAKHTPKLTPKPQHH